MKRVLVLMLCMGVSLLASQKNPFITEKELANLPVFHTIGILERFTGVKHSDPRQFLEQAITKFEEKASENVMHLILNNAAKLRETNFAPYYEKLDDTYHTYLKNIKNFGNRARYIFASPARIKSYQDQAKIYQEDYINGTISSKKAFKEKMFALNKKFTDAYIKIEDKWELIDASGDEIIAEFEKD